MSFLKNIFSKKDNSINSYQDFWNWFAKNEKEFFKAVGDREIIEKNFLDKISPKLNELREGYCFLAGMLNDTTAELIITADGNFKQFIFVEELINSAPAIAGWKFTAFKPAMDIKRLSIEMGGDKFNDTNLSFYSNDLPEYPDEIDITVIHNDLSERNRKNILNGTYIFLDNFLGELDFATTIDNLEIIGKNEAKKELVPIEKLKDFLIWREKEFVEKYEGTRHNTEKDNYSAFEAELRNGNPMIGVINTDLLKWDRKASHPWIIDIEIKFKDGNNGMPDKKTQQQLDDIEDKITAELKDFDGYLNVGRETADNVRNIYFACREFKKPSKILTQVQSDLAGQLEFSYTIFKDKYWKTFNRFTGESN
ncbi:MAG: DUF695 domain-containing protein [Bacteroidia bacterium]